MNRFHHCVPDIFTNKTRSHLLYKFLIIFFYFFILISSSSGYSQPNTITSQPSSSLATNQTNHMVCPQPDSTEHVSLYTSQAGPCGLPNGPFMHLNTSYVHPFILVPFTYSRSRSREAGVRRADGTSTS
jgi:hypothetical protein